MICPLCFGHGETTLEARRMRVGLTFWTEYGCRACGATGYTTPERVTAYHANRERDACEAWRRETLRREREQRERELAQMEREAA